MRIQSIILGGVASLVVFKPAYAQDFEFRPQAGIELRLFPDKPQFEDQLEHLQGSMVLSGEGRWTSPSRNTRIVLEPLVRLDSEDRERTYFDLREASVSHAFNRDWDILVGVSQVFWGVAESRNVVDIINQFDTVADVDESEKLGQPMMRISRRSDIGTFEAYYLPVFRERRFPGQQGRLRTEPCVNAGAARFERAGKRTAGDLALRYTNRLGDIDLGLHGFHGTSRTPRLDFDPESGRLIPFYPELQQAGLDVQWTQGAWLWKAEVVIGEMLNETFSSLVAGFEHTVFDVSGSGIDIGLIGEYLYDDRDVSRLPGTIFGNDIFAGTRVTLNDVQDTELLVGAIVDDRTGAIFASAEFKRRIGDTLLFEFEARFLSASGDPLIAPLESDDSVVFRLTRYF